MIYEEEEYLQIAIKTKEEILDEHWKNVRLERTWTTHKGKKTKFENLSNHHLLMIIRVLSRFLIVRKSEEISLLLLDLINELINRNIIKKEGEI